MIVAERKPLDEIRGMIEGYGKVLTVGCGTCVSVCLAGGSKEVDTLNCELKLALGDRETRLGGHTVKRQCDMEFLAELDEIAENYDAFVSMACGAGIQFLAERFPEKPVFPAVNTVSISVNRDVGWYEENCRACGTCVLGSTGGICPVTACAKGLFNGPCGGTNNGSCEIHNDQPCAWYRIYERLEKQGRLAQIIEFSPPRDWTNQKPRTTVQPGYEERSSARK